MAGFEYTLANLKSIATFGSPNTIQDSDLVYIYRPGSPDKEYKGQWVDVLNYIKANGLINITVGTSPPSSPAIGDLWVDTN